MIDDSSLVSGAHTKNDLSGRPRLVWVWRKDFNHVNKTRDNHVCGLASSFDLTLVVREGAALGRHILDSEASIVRVPCGGSPMSLIGFYRRAMKWITAEHVIDPFDAVVAPIGEEVTGYSLRRRLPGALLVLDLWDVPGLTIDRRLGFKGLLRKLYYFRLQKAMRNAEVVITGVLPEGLEGRVSSDAMLVTSENGVDLNTFSAKPVRGEDEVWDDLAGECRLLYTGYLAESRGSLDLLRAVAKGREEGRSWACVLVGPSNDRELELLGDLIGELSLESACRVVGPVDSRRIPEIIAASDIGVSPLHAIEQFKWSYPVKILEYLSVGRPVVASDLPGHRTRHRPDFGVLHVPGDVGSLYQRLLEVSESEDIKSAAMREGPRFARDYSWERVLENLSTRLKAAILSKTNDERV